MTTKTVPDLEQLIRDGAVRLEITQGVPTWEAFPGSRHQRVIDRIRASIESHGNAYAHLSDVLIRFPDGSLKRPDIAIFCVDPPDQDDALTQIPEAVIEVISPGYEYKDLELNPGFYLSQGCLDVVIVDPRSGAVTHYTAAAVFHYTAPVPLNLECGCRCAIPAAT